MSLWIVIVNVVPLAAACIYFYYKSVFSYWKKRGIKGPEPWIVVGNTIQLLKRGNQAVDMENFHKYGKIWGTYNASKPVLSVSDAELIKQILIKDFGSFINRIDQKGSDPVWTKNIFTAKDEIWKRYRSIMSPSLSSGKLRGMSKLMNESVDKLNRYFDKLATNGAPFEMKKVIAGFTIDVIASTSFAMNTDSNGDREKENPVLYHGTRLFKMSPLRILLFKFIPEPLRTWVGYNIEFNPENFGFFSSLMRRIIEERRRNGIRREDLTQLLIDATDADLDMNDNNWSKLTATGDNTDEQNTLPTSRKQNGKNLEDNEIIAQSIIFFIAGFETTATTITNALYELAMHPEVQDQFREILNKQLADKDPNSLEYYETVNNEIAYMDALIKETLRKYPPVPKLFRQCGVEGYSLRGMVLPKGQLIEIPVFAVHYNPEYYPDPERFIPERFIGVDSKKAPYLSFGQGPRNCIGMRFAYVEVKLALASVIRNFRFTPAPDTPKKLEFQKIGVAATLPFNLCVEKL